MYIELQEKVLLVQHLLNEHIAEAGGVVVVVFTDYNTTPTKLFSFVLLVGLWQYLVRW
jgi:hypothetical protein